MLIRSSAREDCRAAALPDPATPLLSTFDNTAVTYTSAIGDDYGSSKEDPPLATSSTRASPKLSPADSEDENSNGDPEKSGGEEDGDDSENPDDNITGNDEVSEHPRSSKIGRDNQHVGFLGDPSSSFPSSSIPSCYLPSVQPQVSRFNIEPPKNTNHDSAVSLTSPPAQRPAPEFKSGPPKRRRRSSAMEKTTVTSHKPVEATPQSTTPEVSSPIDRRDPFPSSISSPAPPSSEPHFESSMKRPRRSASSNVATLSKAPPSIDIPVVSSALPLAGATGPLTLPELPLLENSSTNQKRPAEQEIEDPGKSKKIKTSGSKETVDVGQKKKKVDTMKHNANAKRRSVRAVAPSVPLSLPHPTTNSLAPLAPSSKSATVPPTTLSTLAHAPEEASSSFLASSGSQSPSLPPDCDQAIKNTLILVTSGDWGVKWKALTAAWLQFEGLNGYKGSSKRIASSGRPQVIHAWIKRARTSTYRPAIDTDKFEHEFWAWWVSIQPKWRKIKAGTTVRVISGGWDALNVPGANGWPSIVAALFFWGHQLRSTKAGLSSWNLAVDDVCWVLQQLVVNPSAI